MTVRSQPGHGGSGECRVVVLGECVEAIATIHMALWLWPHEVVTANDATEAVRLTGRLTPDAIIVTDPVFYSVAQSLILEPRSQEFNVPVIVLYPYGCSPPRGSVLEREAYAVLAGQAKNIPVLQYVLARARRSPCEAFWRANDLPPRLPPIWRDSDTVGALICDNSGAVIDANETIAKWLGLGSRRRLVGREVGRDLKFRKRAWPEWEQLSAGLRQLIQGSWSVRGPDERMFTVQSDVLASPGNKRYMHVSLYCHEDISNASAVAIGALEEIYATA